MSKYKVTVPFVADMGSISPFTVTDSQTESARENALWYINSMRDHDGLPHSLGYAFTHLPKIDAAIAKAEGK